MPDIVLDFPIRAARERVFQAVSNPDGLDRWWTERCVQLLGDVPADPAPVPGARRGSSLFEPPGRMSPRPSLLPDRRRPRRACAATEHEIHR